MSSNWKDEKEGNVNEILATLTAAPDEILLHLNVSPQATNDMDRSRIVLGTLLDTGSLAGNYISAAAVRRRRVYILRSRIHGTNVCTFPYSMYPYTVHTILYR